MTPAALRPRIRQDIEARTDKILRDLGYPEPPLRLEQVRELIRLDLAYYSTERDGLLASTVSKMKRAGKQLLRRPGLLGDAIRKFSLRALYLPDQKRVLIDDAIPGPKQRWLEAHEIGHDLLPWHGEMMMGDDDATVTASAHDKMEAEANYAAGSLLFLGDRFREECRALDPPTLAKAQELKKSFGNTLTTTFWRMIEYAGEERPMLGLIGVHPCAGEAAGAAAFRHLIFSPAFALRFADPDLGTLQDEIRAYCGRRRKGPLGSGAVLLRDREGARHEFRFETFFNGYDALTLAVHQQPVARVIGFSR